MCVGKHMNTIAHRGQKRISDSPGPGIFGGYELPDMEARTQIWVFCKSSMHYEHLSSPPCNINEK